LKISHFLNHHHMLKKYKILDLLFLFICSVFAVLSIYEFLRFIIPLYSYTRALWVFILLVAMYYFYNTFWAYYTPKIPKLKKSSQWVQKQAHPPQVWLIKIKDFIFGLILLLYRLSQKYIEILVYGTFVLVAILLMLGQMFDIQVLTVYAIIAFSIVYLYGRCNWFKLETNISKSSFRSFNVLRFVTILYAAFYVILTYMLDRFQLPANDKLWVYVLSSILYIVSMSVIFFDLKPIYVSLWNWLKNRLLRPYPIFMLILISGLSVYLVAKNNLVEQIGEWVEQMQEQTQDAGGIVLPWVISDTTDVINQEQQEIQYETVLVWEEYDIEPGLALWSTGQSVELLQTVLWNLQYFLWEVNGEFAEDTQSALTDALQSECDWPDTTRGIFGPLAKECIDSLEISRQIEASVSTEIISDEAIIN